MLMSALKCINVNTLTENREMKEFKGTPGPWFVNGKRGDFIDIRHNNDEIGAMSLNLARVVARPSWSKEAEANAHLIAAAPELLEALQDLEARACIYVNTSKAKEAITKALGEKK